MAEKHKTNYSSRTFSFLSSAVWMRVFSGRSTFHVSLDLFLQNMVVSRVDVFHNVSGSERKRLVLWECFLHFVSSMVASHIAKLSHAQKKMKKSSNGAYNKRNLFHGGVLLQVRWTFNGDNCDIRSTNFDIVRNSRAVKAMIEVSCNVGGFRSETVSSS